VGGLLETPHLTSKNDKGTVVNLTTAYFLSYPAKAFFSSPLKKKKKKRFSCPGSSQFFSTNLLIFLWFINGSGF
jgi:hypothetical protein